MLNALLSWQSKSDVEKASGDVPRLSLQLADQI